MREREELSGGERDYISSKITGRKVASFFLPGLGQIWSRRRGLFRGTLCFGLGLGLLAAIGGGDGAEGAGVISWLVSMILTLVNFTKEAYKHDMPYFQRYLDEYAKLNGGNVSKNNKSVPNKQYEDDERTTVYSKKSNGKYNKYGFDEDGYNREGYNAYGFDRDGFNRDGYNDLGYDRNGFDREGYNYKGFNKDGIDKDGYGIDGYNKEGYKKDGYDKRGVDRDGYDRAGYDKDGYDKDGYDDEGYDKDGYNRNGINKFGEKKVNKKRSTKKKLSKPKKADK